MPRRPTTPRPSPTARTGAGVVVGTVGYMAPEQVRGEPIDHRADIFALGVVMHEMLSGARPFRRDTIPETLTAILKDDAPELPPAVTPAFAASSPVPREAARGSIPFRSRSRPRARIALDDD